MSIKLYFYPTVRDNSATVFLATVREVSSLEYAKRKERGLGSDVERGLGESFRFSVFKSVRVQHPSPDLRRTLNFT